MSYENFMAETERLSTRQLEDLLYFWKELAAIAVFTVGQVEETLHQRYEQEEIEYWYTEWGRVRRQNGHREPGT